MVSFLVLRLSNSKCWNSFRLDIDIYLNARVGREGVNLPTNVNNLNLYNCNGCTNEKEEEYLMRKFSLVIWVLVKLLLKWKDIIFNKK